MEQRKVNPWTWQDQYGFSQAIEVKGAERVLYCAGQTSSGPDGATLHGDDASGTVMLTPEEQQEFLTLKPKMFKPSAGAWGRQGCTDVRLDSADARTLRQAVTLAFERVMSKPKAKPRKKAR